MDPMDDYYHNGAPPQQELEHNGGDNNLDGPPAPLPQASSVSAVGGSGTGGDHSKIFVGALSWQTTEESLRIHFEQYGPVQSVEVVRDRHTGGTYRRDREKD